MRNARAGVVRSAAIPRTWRFYGDRKANQTGGGACNYPEGAQFGLLQMPRICVSLHLVMG